MQAGNSDGTSLAQVHKIQCIQSLLFKPSFSQQFTKQNQFSFSPCVFISGGPLSALTCCVNVRLLSAIKKISPLIYSQSWVGSWVYTTQAMMTFTLIF